MLWQLLILGLISADPVQVLSPHLLALHARILCPLDPAPSNAHISTTTLRIAAASAASTPLLMLVSELASTSGTGDKNRVIPRFLAPPLLGLSSHASGTASREREVERELDYPS